MPQATMRNRPSAGARPERPRDVALSAMVPHDVRRAVQQHAAAEGVTVRTVLLRLIRDAGLAEIDEAEIMDRRTVRR